MAYLMHFLKIFFSGLICLPSGNQQTKKPPVNRSSKPSSQTILREQGQSKPSSSDSSLAGRKTETKASREVAAKNISAAVTNGKAVKRQREVQGDTTPSKAKKKRTSESSSVNEEDGDSAEAGSQVSVSSNGEGHPDEKVRNALSVKFFLGCLDTLCCLRGSLLCTWDCNCLSVRVPSSTISVFFALTFLHLPLDCY